MSRIHEALKKAEQERGAQPAEQPIILPPTATPQPVSVRLATTSAAVAENHVVSPSSVMPIPGGVLQYEDLQGRTMRSVWQSDPTVNVFTNPEAAARGAEQFRTLRSRIYQIRAAQPVSTVLITSSVPTEGKTFVTANLAQAIIRQPERRVLIIDADMRCPRLHEMVGAPQTPGLTDYLRGESDEFGVMQNGGAGNLWMIAGGTRVTNPSELLSNGRLKVLLERLTPIFDWVLLDAPPCLPVADASVIADTCDGVLFVVKAGSTPAAVAQRALQELRGRNILGVVLNAVENAHTYGSSYYQTYGYAYGYGSGGSNT
jgi:protein-tyrosine kinase